MALEVGIVGPAGSGKTSLFTALTKAGGGDYGKTNLGIAPIADDRLGALAEIVHARKVTAATIRVQDVPGTGAALLGNLRQVEALLVVVAGFGPGRRPGRRPRDVHARVDRRRPRPRRAAARAREKQAKSGDAKLRTEVEELSACSRTPRPERRSSHYPGELPGGLEPLTTKPLIAVVNGPGGIDLKLEAELAELPDDEAEAFRDGGASALDDVAGRLRDALDLITFFTAGEKETRAWTLRNGETALDAADAIHSDIARGFIRCEVVDWRTSSRPARTPRSSRQRPAAPRGQDLRRPRRRRAEHPLQRLAPLEISTTPVSVRAIPALLQRRDRARAGPRRRAPRHDRVERGEHRGQADQTVADDAAKSMLPSVSPIPTPTTTRAHAAEPKLWPARGDRRGDERSAVVRKTSDAHQKSTLPAACIHGK